MKIAAILTLAFALILGLWAASEWIDNGSSAHMYANSVRSSVGADHFALAEMERYQAKADFLWQSG